MTAVPGGILRRLIHGSAVTAAAQAGGMIISVITAALLTRTLGSSKLGMFFYLQGLALMLTAFAGSGLAAAIVRFLPVHRMHLQNANRLLASAFTVSLVLSAAMAAFMVGLGPWPTEELLWSAGITPLSRWLTALSLIPNTVCALQLAALAGLESFGAAAVSNFLKTVVQATLATAGSAISGIDGALAGAFAAVVAQCWFNEYCIRRSHGSAGARRYLTWRPDLSSMRGFSVPVYLASVINAPAHQIVNDVLMRCSGDAVQVALLGVAHQWRNAFLFLPGVLGQVALPVLSASPQRTRMRVLIVLAAGSSGGLYLLALCAFWMGPVFDRIYSPELAGSSALIGAIGVAAAFYSAGVFLGQHFLLECKPWMGVASNAAQMALLWGLSRVLTAAMEPASLGAAWSFAAAYAGQLALMMVVAAFTGFARPTAPRAPGCLFIQFTDPAYFPVLVRAGLVMTRRGYDVTYVGIRQPHLVSLSPPRGLAGIHYVPRAPSEGLASIYASFCLLTIRMAMAKRPSAMYLSDLYSTPVGLICYWLLGTPIVYHEHDCPAPPHRWTLRALFWCRRWVLRRSNFCVAPNVARTRLLVRSGASVDKTVHAMNTPLLEECLDSSPSLHTGAFRLYYHGSLNEIRLPVAVLDALAAMPNRVELTVAGFECPGGDYGSRLERRAAELGLANRFRFLGTIPSHEEMLDEAARCHLGLALMPLDTSDINEQTMAGASQKAFEYLARGLPLLVSDRPEWRELYVDRNVAVACDPGSAPSIRTAVESLLFNPILHNAMSRRGVDLVRTEWNYETSMAPVLTRLEAIRCE